MGLLKELGPTGVARFICYNIGQFPIQITSVKTSCGCTLADWTKEIIQPGDSGFVEAFYDPKGRPGPFEKAVYVYTDGVPYSHFLTIAGDVEPKPKTKEDDFPSKFGWLMMTQNDLNMGFVYPDEIDTITATIYNSSRDTIKILGVTGRPSYLLIELQNLSLAPKSENKITFIFNAKQANDWGEIIIPLKIRTTDVSFAEMDVFVHAHIMERFPKLNERKLKKAPQIAYDTTEKVFGKVLKGDSITVYFNISNNGKKPLKIRKIQSNCGCTGALLNATEIKKGKTEQIALTFFTEGRSSGEEEKTITVITNDPRRPISKLIIRGEIVENPNALKEY